MKESEEVIRNLAFVIWQDRSRRGKPDANDEKKNWVIAKQALYPETLTTNDHLLLSQLD